MTTATDISFSPEQQLALLGHLVRNQRVYDATVHIGMKAADLYDPNAQRIFSEIVNFVKRFKRYPTEAELRSGNLRREEPKIVQAAMRTLDQALEQSSKIGLETVFDDLVRLRVGTVFAQGMQDSATIWNKNDQDAAIAKLFEVCQQLNHLTQNGLSAMAKSSADWYDVSIERQKATPSRLVYTGLSFLDEPMCGIKPDDLVVVTSRTGIGKSQLMVLIAMNIAASGKKVKLFALEAGKAEVETRLRWPLVLDGYYAAVGKNTMERPDYVEWSRGLRPDLDKYEPKADELKTVLKNINVTYKQNSRYGIEQLERDILAVAADVDVILIDHLHYIDHGGAAETAALAEIVARIRDINLMIDRPVILAAHVRKHQGARRDQALLPSTDDIHGSSDISKNATWIVALGQMDGVDEDKVPVNNLRLIGYGQPTLVRLLKSRDGGGSRTAHTMVPFFRHGVYHRNYTIGRMTGADTRWTALPEVEIPQWAKSCFAMKNLTTKQGEKK